MYIDTAVNIIILRKLDFFCSYISYPVPLLVILLISSILEITLRGFSKNYLEIIQHIPLFTHTLSTSICLAHPGCLKLN